MKRLSLFFVACSATLFFASCNKEQEKLFSTTIPVRIEADALEMVNEGVEIDLSKIADVLAENEELNAVKDKIKSYELVQIKYKVYEYWNSPTNIFDGYIGFGNANMTEAGVTKALSGFNIQESMDATNQTVISFTADENDLIQTYFKDTNSLKIFFKGDLSEVPATFKLYLQVDINAIADTKK